MNTQKILSGVVVVLGLYMIVGFYNGSLLTPPVISGVAIILLAVRGCFPKG